MPRDAAGSEPSTLPSGDVVPLLYRNGRIYDAIIRDDIGDVEFLRSLVLQRPGPALELASGTGRLMIAWAIAGRAVTGIDTSPALLERAQSHAANAGVTIRTVLADMRQFRLESQFDSVVLGGDSIGHLHGEDELQACIACVRSVLSQRGVFIIDAPVPESRLLNADPAERFHWGRYEDPATGEPVEVTFRADYSEASQVLRLQICAEEGGRSFEGGRLALRMWRPADLERVLAAAGFEVRARFGNYRGASPGARSPRHIVVCSPAG